MTDSPLARIKATAAAEICSRFYLPVEARQQLRAGMTPREFLGVLLEKKRYIDAVDFIAHGLSPRDAIWWGCLCVQHACGDSLTETQKTACKSAVLWVLEPTEANRAAAKPPAEAAGCTTPAGALAAAANQTGGSIGPPNVPPIPPAPYAPAQAVAMAVKLATTKGDPTKMAVRQRAFVELGIGVAEGRFTWPGSNQKRMETCPNSLPRA